jgi:hypothetical protein
MRGALAPAVPADTNTAEAANPTAAPSSRACCFSITVSPSELVTSGLQEPARFLSACVRAGGQELKCAIAGAQPTPWIQTFWIPAMSGAMSPAETIICAVKDSSLPSPAR